MKQKIIRSDGIEYERKSKIKNYTAVLYARIEPEKIEVLKKIANENKTRYSDFVRNIIDEYIEKEINYAKTNISTSKNQEKI